MGRERGKILLPSHGRKGKGGIGVAVDEIEHSAFMLIKNYRVKSIRNTQNGSHYIRHFVFGGH